MFQHSRYEDLCADEKVLDAMFDRTKHAVMIERAAQSLAEQLIQSLQSKGDIDGAVKELVQGEGREEMPEEEQSGGMTLS